MQKDEITSVEHDDGSYVVKKTKKSSILAFVFCVLLAFVIWAYAEAEERRSDADVNTDDTQVNVEVSDVESAS